MNLLPPPGTQRTRSLVLLGLLVVLVAWLWWPAAPGPTAPAVATNGSPIAPGAVPAPATSSSRPPPARPQAVQLAVLQPDRRQLDVGRNLFRYGARPLPPPPPAPPTPPIVQGPPPPPVPQGPPPVPLKFAGRVVRPDGTVVVTLKHAETGALFHVTEGGVVDGRYRLVKVGVQTVVVSYLDGSGQRTLSEGGL